jgi:predicted HicB family RNase H-like nuclease
MNYKGYTAKIEFDEASETFHGRIGEIRDIITFEGGSVAELKKAFHDSVEDYLEWATEEGFPPERPYSGRLMLRLPPDVHRQAAALAQKRGESLNTLVRSCVVRELSAPAAPSKARRRSTAE